MQKYLGTNPDISDKPFLKRCQIYTFSGFLYNFNCTEIISYLSKKKKRSNFGQFSCTLFKSNVFDAINLSRNTKAVLQSVVYLLSYSRLKVENEKCKQFPLANKMYSISETAADIQPAQPYTCCSNQVQMTVQLFLLHILQALAI